VLLKLRTSSSERTCGPPCRSDAPLRGGLLGPVRPLRLADQLGKDLRLFAPEAVGTALDALSETASPPVSHIGSMRTLPTRTGLPQLDRASWEQGFADGFHGRVWWPGPGTEPLSYSAGYTEAQAESDARPAPKSPPTHAVPRVADIGDYPPGST
jgi:hypothetical protein